MKIASCHLTKSNFKLGKHHEMQVNAEGYVMCTRYLYLQIRNGLPFDQIKNLQCSSVYCSLFEMGGRAQTWKYIMNFQNNNMERTLKFLQALTEDNLSICFGKLLSIAKS